MHAKKAVFVEWPLANGLQEAEELAALAKKQGVKTAVGLQSRLHPSIQKAKEIIDSGALGRITGTTLLGVNSVLGKMSEKNSYINNPALGANLITIAVMHALDPLLYLLGEFKSFNATTATVHPELRFIQADGSKGEPVKSRIADFVSISGVLESGAAVNFVLESVTAATPENMEWIISGEKGSLKLETPAAFLTMSPPNLYRTTTPEQDSEGKDRKGKAAWEGRGKAQWEEVEYEKGGFGGIGEVYTALAEGNKDLVDFDVALQRHKVVEAILRSAENGTRETF